MTTIAPRATARRARPAAHRPKSALAELEPRRFTVDEYYRMAEAGILAPGERTELLHGIIVPMMAPGPFHASRVNRLTRLFVSGVGRRAIVSVQNPLRLDNLSEPQPDLTILRPRRDEYAASHPGPGDTMLAIEVCDSSLPKDEKVKLPLYAEKGIPEVWLIDVRGRRIAVCRDPAGGTYRDVRRLSGKARLSPLAFPDLVFTVAQILGD